MMTVEMWVDRSCQNHSADDAVRARAKGPCLRGRTETAFTPYKRKEERGGTQLTRQRSSRISILPWGPDDVNGLSDARVRIQPR